MTTTVGVKLDDEKRDRLKSLGEMKQRSVHWLMRQAIQDYVEREEREERRNQEADEAWLEYKQSGLGVDNDAMMTWLDSWGTDKEIECPNPKPHH